MIFFQRKNFHSSGTFRQKKNKNKTKQKKLERSCEDSEKRKGTTKGDGKVKRKKKQKQTNKKHQKKRRRELVDRNWSGSSDVTLRRPRFPTHFPANALIESRRRLRSTVSSVIVEPQRFPSDFLSFLPSFFFKERSLPGSRVSSALPFLPVRTKKKRVFAGFYRVFFFKSLPSFFFIFTRFTGFVDVAIFSPTRTVEGVSGFFYWVFIGFYRVFSKIFTELFFLIFTGFTGFVDVAIFSPTRTVEGVSGFFLLGFYRVLPSFFKNIYRVVFF